MKQFLLSFLIITITSCGPVFSVVENTNTNRKFETTQAYLDFINKKTDVQNDKVILLNGDIHSIFAFEIANKKLDCYYGIVNENYFAGAEQLEMKGCAGQMETLYKMVAGNSDKVVKTQKNDVAVLEKLHLDASKNTLLFIYSYKLGGYSKRKIAGVIKNLSARNDFDYRLIALDYYDIVNR